MTLTAQLFSSLFVAAVSFVVIVMAPKPSAEKKPAQPAKKAVAKKSTGGKKKGSKKAVESYKIYIYKVCTLQRTDRLAVIKI